MIPRNSFDSSLPGGNNLVISTGNNPTTEWLWRNGHEPVRSYPIHENLTLYEGLPPQGLSEARRAGCFLNLLFPIRRWGALFWGGGNHRIQNGNNPRIIAEYDDFQGKSSMKKRIGNIRYFYVHLSCIGSGRYANVHFAIRKSVDTNFYEPFSGGQHPS